MKIKKFVAVILSICILFCLFGCESDFAPEKVKCILGEEPQEINILRAELNDSDQTITAVIDENNKIVFHCQGIREYDGYKICPEWLRLYKLDVTVKNTSPYTLKNIRPYLKRQWDMLISDDFEVGIEQLAPHSDKATVTIYAITDYDISVMRSAFVDNLFKLLYDVYDKDVKLGEYETDFSYK